MRLSLSLSLSLRELILGAGLSEVTEEPGGGLFSLFFFSLFSASGRALASLICEAIGCSRVSPPPPPECDPPPPESDPRVCAAAAEEVAERAEAEGGGVEVVGGGVTVEVKEREEEEEVVEGRGLLRSTTREGAAAAGAVALGTLLAPLASPVCACNVCVIYNKRGSCRRSGTGRVAGTSGIACVCM
jgi:hypothetical protein